MLDVGSNSSYFYRVGYPTTTAESNEFQVRNLLHLSNYEVKDVPQEIPRWNNQSFQNVPFHT